MSETKRPSFGWLLLGLCWGLLLGHAFGMFVVVSLVDYRESARWCLYATLAGGMLGIGAGAMIDCFAERSATWLDWVVFGVAIPVYLFLMPAVNVAME